MDGEESEHSRAARGRISIARPKASGSAGRKFSIADKNGNTIAEVPCPVPHGSRAASWLWLLLSGRSLRRAVSWSAVAAIVVAVTAVLLKSPWSFENASTLTRRTIATFRDTGQEIAPTVQAY